ncbi:uncharacterized protein SETTUDRAFT_165939 [Exserohilum turcica Et28A]|uniref:Uncharacterized protein n=1 Tax=Exserohilum turcicum (strain 28A) TaxID=671987 RepID=R0I7P0_EXST2|nr:uncharacterized protein SETTUDRAFT_165939 [Exserohilum turcica Et28A]EOA81471.1 hypothetical protein SETTUDRAFT_165939 [Exserohilum turcica Et28A]
MINASPQRQPSTAFPDMALSRIYYVGQPLAQSGCSNMMPVGKASHCLRRRHR